MSSPEPHRIARQRRAGRSILALCAVLLVVAAGCTVRPLYGDVTAATGSPSTQALASIEVKPVNDRVGQEVRNHLIFLLGGGAGQPNDAAYTVTMSVTASAAAASVVQVGTSDYEPTSSVVTVRTSYTLADANGTKIAAGTRSVQAAYDVPRQGFAALRAQRDGENRAARELAEQLRLAIAQDLERPSGNVAPAVISSAKEIEGFSSED